MRSGLTPPAPKREFQTTKNNMVSPIAGKDALRHALRFESGLFCKPINVRAAKHDYYGISSLTTEW
jgi:hypothetical protein